MAMPNHLVLVRHGESEGNIARSAFKDGDPGYLTDDFRDRPGHEWRLTPKGVEQAQQAGIWIQENIIEPYGLPKAGWQLNRLLREREWGEIQWFTEPEHREQYPANYKWMQKDSLNWAPPGGESIAQIADNRVREVLDTLHRDHDTKDVDSVIAVTHGEWMWASRLVLEYMFNEDWDIAEEDPTQKIRNCQVVHYTRLNPDDGSQAPYLRWMRSVTPWIDEAPSDEWIEAIRRPLTNEELLEQVEALPRLFQAK